MNRFTENVRKGMALLDEKRPGWFEETGVGYLDMRNCQQCMLGQLFGHFYDALSELFQWTTQWEQADNQDKTEFDRAVEHGFAVDDTLFPRKPNEGITDHSKRLYSELGAEWVKQINLRRASGGQQVADQAGAGGGDGANPRPDAEVGPAVAGD
jgi:hypothetical protein